MRKTATVTVASVVTALTAVGWFVFPPYRQLATIIEDCPAMAAPLLRAAVVAAETPKDRSGATITEQLCRVPAFPRPNPARVLKSVVLRIAIDLRFSDDEILSAYMARVYLGHGHYGMTAAAHYYFDRAPDELSLAESALLAGMIRSPNRYSPLLHPTRAIERRNRVLGSMRDRNFISESEFTEAARRPLGPGG